MRWRGRQRGLATVEFALSVPLLLLLMLATAEFVRAFTQYATLASGVRNAVRHVAGKALMNSGVIAIDSTLVNEARNLVRFGNVAGTGAQRLSGLTANQITVTAPDTVNVRVTAQYTYRPLMGSIPAFGFGSDISTGFTFNVSSTLRAL